MLAGGDNGGSDYNNGGTPPEVDLFFVNTVGGLSHYQATQWTWGWNQWAHPTGYEAVGSPAAVGLGDMRIGVSAMDSGGDLLTWKYDWGTITKTRLPGDGTKWPSSPSGIAMTYSSPGGP